MKNVIIFSCSTGQGHNSCAGAVRDYFEEKGVACAVCDSLTFISPGFARFMSWGHSFMYKHIPRFFEWGYRLNERHPALLEKGSPLYGLLTSGEKRMYRFLLDGKYDTVICTHMFPAIALTRLLERYPLPVQTAFVATDYTCYPGAGSTGLQGYFIPCKPLSGDFMTRIPAPHRTVVSGIPVRREFWDRREKEEAKRALGIGEKNRHLLMMGGSMGCGPIVKLLQYVAGELPADTEVTVICGTNRRLYRKLDRRYRGNGRIHIVGYTEDVCAYMDAADLYLTKPGGISVTEAAAKNLPMAFVDAVSGCEKYNMDFFTDMGAAVTDPSVRGLARKCVRLLSSGDGLDRMQRALELYGQPNGAEIIYANLE